MDNSSYRMIRVARDRDLFEQIGREIYFDLVNQDRVHSFRVPRNTPFLLFKKQVAQEFGIPEQLQRFWKWQTRLNLTYRPFRPLTPEEESKPIGELTEMNKQKETELNLFLEVELGPDLCPVSPPVKTSEEILLFFKLYDHEKGQLRYVGRLFAKKYATFRVILRKVNEMAGFRLDEEIDLYEEIKYKPDVMCELIDKDDSLEYSQLEDGDIICFQKALVKTAQSCGYLTIPSFLEKLLPRRRQEAEAPNLPSQRISWRISNFSKFTSKKCCSEVFIVDGCKWKIVVYPRGSHRTFSDKISIYLSVADHASLPIGWTRTVDFGLTVVNQIDQDLSITRDGSGKFNALAFEWGFPSFMSLLDLHHPTRGYLVRDTLVVEADVFVLKTASSIVAPDVGAPSAPVRRETDRFISCLNSLGEFIGAAETAAGTEGTSSGTQTSHTVPTCPSLEEVESAKRSLKECLSDHFNLNMKERLASALSTLSTAEAGVSPEQRKSVLQFQVHRMHLSYKELLEKLSKEEEEEDLNKKLEETRSRKSKLISDWEVLTAVSEVAKSRYVSRKRKQPEAEEKKRKAEEGLSRFKTAWSSLRALFP